MEIFHKLLTFKKTPKQLIDESRIELLDLPRMKTITSCSPTLVPDDFGDALAFLWNVSRTIGLIAKKFGADIHVAQKMNPADCIDLLEFSSSAPAGQKFSPNQYNISMSTRCIGTKL